MISVDLGLLILRLVAGLSFAGHGAQKLFGWFGGGGIAGTGAWLGGIGLRPGRLWAVVAGLGEFAGGVLLALGLLNPLGAIGVGGVMLMATLKVHWPKYWVSRGGFELPAIYATVAAVVGLLGPGAYSLDSVLGITVPAAPAGAVLLAAIVVVVGGLIWSRPAPQAPSQTDRAA